MFQTPYFPLLLSFRWLNINKGGRVALGLFVGSARQAFLLTSAHQLSNPSGLSRYYPNRLFPSHKCCTLYMLP